MVLFLSLFVSLLFSNDIDSINQENLKLYEERLTEQPSNPSYVWAYFKTVETICSTGLSSADLQSGEPLSVYGITKDTICNTDDTNALFYTIGKQNGDLDILIHYLAFESDTETRDRVVANLITSGQYSQEQTDILRNLRNYTPFTSFTLPFDYSPFVHSALIQSEHYQSLFGQNYIEKSLNSWISIYNNSEQLGALEKAILYSNIFARAFLLDQYEFIVRNYLDLVNNELYPYNYFRYRLYRAMNYALSLTGRYSQSLDLARNHRIPLAEYFGNQTDIDESRLWLANSLQLLGKFEESNNIYHSLESDSSSQINKAVLYTNMSVNYDKLGNKNLYFEYQIKALNEAEITDYSDTEQYRNVLTIYYNLMVSYLEREDIASVNTYGELATDLAKKVDDERGLAEIDLFYCKFYWDRMKDPISALEKCKAAENTIKNTQYYLIYIDVLQEKANILQDVKQFDAATEAYRKIKSLALETSDQNAYIETLIDLSEIELERGNIAETKKNLDEIRSYNDSDLEFKTIIEKLNLEAEYLYRINETRLALTMIEEEIDQVLEWIRNSSDSQTGFRDLPDEYIKLFNLNLELLIETGQINRGITFLDKVKTLNDVILFNSPLVKVNKLSEEKLYEEKALSEQIESLRKNYLTAGKSDRITIKTQIDRLSAQREELLSDVKTNNELGLLPSFWSIQRMIDDNTMLVHFTEIGEKLYKSTISRKNVNIEVLNGNELGIFDLIDSAADNLSGGEPDLNELYHLTELLGLTNLSKATNKLIIIPDNHLYRIPLDILPVKKPHTSTSYGSAHYLLEDHEIEFFTSLNEFVYNQRGINQTFEDDISIFAISEFGQFNNRDLPNLPYTRIEAEWIRIVLGSYNNINSYIESDATAESFKREMGRSRIVHVATHSEVSEEDPLFSTIYLNQSGSAGPGLASEDQALYAYELFNTELNTELIVLNSCSSGSGKYMQGTGIMGISRALRYAGARSLALNLWSVNDHKAADFSKEFYGYIDQGLSKSTAMREAKLSLLRSGSANPHFWGAYMLIGNPSPFRTNSNKSILTFAFLAAVIMTAGYSVRKQI